MLRSTIEYWSLLKAESEYVNDRDLADGAGDVLLQVIREAEPRLQQKEIKDKQDFRNAVAFALNPRDGFVRIEERHLDMLLVALRLLSVGYYRALLVEEMGKVGRIECRAAAASRFRERISEEEPSWSGTAGAEDERSPNRAAQEMDEEEVDQV